ncbi:long-chain-fatty-acid--CoA ligase [Sphingomonas sp.]|uniref:long-chain-fatty-acid--CoA ligase n=1 Tax=Sphingomonas sp. TaxID=28214 RepID=UPI002FC649AB
MLGLMQDWPLTLDRLLVHAARWHGDQEIVSREQDGSLSRTTYGTLHGRARRLSNALRSLGIGVGDRVGTLAWNRARHIETWYGIMGIGAVCHTLNPRLFADQLVYIINHAETRILFADVDLVPFITENIARLPKLEHVVLMTDEAGMVECPKAVAYETLIAAQSEDCEWGSFDEQTAAGLCYTSGTTGNPKGVLYSHRSNFMHALISLQADMFGLAASDVVLAVVPMFHANAWGLSFAAPAVGAKLVMPGSRLDGEAVFELIEKENVTFSAAVPTVWQMLLHYMQQTGKKPTSLRRVVVGGSACPESLIRAFHDDYGIELLHLWGMTEMSPVGTVGAMSSNLASKSFEEQMPYRLKQGRPPIGVDLALFDDDDKPVPHDGKTFGRLKVKGGTVTSAYMGNEPGSALDKAGWFDTSDIATIDTMGFMQITDRAKDLIKSGGEWISSIEIENIAVGHPDVAVAAVIAIPDAKWDERPLLVIEPIPGHKPAPDELLHFLDGKIARWWMPNGVAIVDKIPLGATGKIDKKVLRDMAAAGTFDQAVKSAKTAAAAAE